ncbi:MAG: hypothetical protein ACRCZZ_11080 [Phocaeicola sp.]
MVTVLVTKPNIGNGRQVTKMMVPANRIWQSNIPFTCNKRLLQDNVKAMMKGAVVNGAGIKAWIVK